MKISYTRVCSSNFSTFDGALDSSMLIIYPVTLLALLLMIFCLIIQYFPFTFMFSVDVTDINSMFVVRTSW
jgi:hypothetical protein